MLRVPWRAKTVTSSPGQCATLSRDGVTRTTPDTSRTASAAAEGRGSGELAASGSFSATDISWNGSPPVEKMFSSGAGSAVGHSPTTSAGTAYPSGTSSGLSLNTVAWRPSSWPFEEVTLAPIVGAVPRPGPCHWRSSVASRLS